jgi:hypothetical protein
MAFAFTGIPVEQVAVVEVQKIGTELQCSDSVCLVPAITRVEIPAENVLGAPPVSRREI